MGTKWQQAIVGIGLNVHQTDFESTPHATSLLAETGKRFDKVDLVKILAIALETRYINLKNNPQTPIHDEYIEKMYRFGTPHVFQRVADGHFFSGTIVGVSDYGQLQIEVGKECLHFGIKEVKFCH